MSSLKMAHTMDPAEEILAKFAHGALDKVEVFHNCILVATYVRPEKTASGLYLADSTRKEDEYQGKVGLVLKKGPMAFVDDAVNQFNGLDVNVGDWVAYNMNDGWQLKVGGVHCRILQDAHIKIRAAEPDVIY